MKRVLNRITEYISDPVHQIRWWAFWTIAWVILDPVTMLTPLAHSVPWLNQESLFANFASCGTALVAAWSYFRARRVDESEIHKKLDHIVKHHPDIPDLP